MGPVELLAPKALWLLSAIVPLVTLYILKIRRKRLKVGSTLLWAAARRDLMAKQPFRRLIPELPLILQILAIILLSIVLARPAMRGARIFGDHVAIVIDTSASMATRLNDGSTRIAEAKRAAADVVTRLSPGTDAIVIEAAKEAEVASPLERDPAALRAAIDALDAREVEGDLSSAVALAADRLRSLGGKKKIFVVTDGALAHDTPLAASGASLEVVTVGDLEDNAAVVRIDVRSEVDPATKHEEVQVFAMVRNYAARPREAFVTLALDGQPGTLASRRVLLPADDKLPVVLTFEPRAEDHGKGLLVQIAPGDALPLDDVAYARVPLGVKMPVVLATDAPYSWTARALDADADLDVQRLTIEQLGRVNVDPESLVVVEGACPATLPGRDLLVLAPPVGSCLGIDVAPPIAAPPITSWETGDPRFRFLSFDGVHVAHATPLDAAGSTASLVRTTEATLVADASTPGRAATIVGFDVGDSDWPLRASFVLFVRNIVELARLHGAQGIAGAARTGEPLRIVVPAGTTSVDVTGPGLSKTSLPARGGFAILPTVARAGFYRVAWTEPSIGEELVTANLTSEAESDVRPRKVAAADGGNAAGAPFAKLEASHAEWGAWLALVAALVLAADIFLLTRAPRPSSRGAGAGLRAPRITLGGAALATLGVLPLVYVGLVRLEALHETYVRFQRPAALLAVAAAGVFLGLRLPMLPARMTRTRRALVVVLGAACLFAAVFAFAEPDIGHPLDRLTVLVAVDRSRSIDLVPHAEQRISAELAVAERSMHDDDRIGTVVFAAGAVTEDPPRPRSDLPPPQRVELGRDATDLAAGIRRALAELPPDSAARVVLLSDGVETRGDALGAAAAAVAANVPIDAVVLEQKAVRDVRVVAVRAPPRANEGETIDLRVVTESAEPTPIEVRVLRDGEPLRTGQATIGKGEDVLHLREIEGEPGLHRYDVQVSAKDPGADGTPEDNAGSAFVRVRGPSLALLLEGDDGKAEPMAAALRDGGFLVKVGGAADVPADVGGFAGYDLVVVSDIPASDLSATQVDAMASYAKDLGGGLVLMGGDRSMGPGGYARTSVEDVSPVKFDLKQEKRRASLAEVIAVDYSGSMGMTVGGQTKLALANEAAARSASLLGPGDFLGVEHVDTEVAWTIPMSAVDDPEAMGRRIRAVDVGGGGIYTDVALKAGYAALAREKVNLEHLLLLADGNDAEQIEGCRSLVHAAATQGITTSVISLGRGKDTPELEVLSKIGGGRFYLIEDATRLPAVFTQETILAAKSAIHETDFVPSPTMPGAAMRGLDFGDAPPLHGYVVTVPDPRAAVLLTGPDGDPILATWSVGIGKVAAFTSDYKDRWGKDWVGWAPAAKMFVQLARDTARGADDPRVRLECDASGGELHVRADVVDDDGRAQTFRRLTVHVGGPDGFSRDVPLEAVGAGRYAADVPLSRPGTYIATAKDEVTNEAVGTSGAVLGVGEELRPTGSDRALLGQVAALTGGKMRDTLAGIFEDRGARRFAYTPAAPWLAMLAALSMLLAVAARRLAVPDVAGALAARLRAGRERRANAKAQSALAEAKAAAVADADRAKLNEAVLARRQRGAQTAARAAAPLFAAKPNRAASTGASTLHDVAPRAAPASPEAATKQTAQAPTPERPLTVAERLAQKKRDRR